MGASGTCSWHFLTGDFSVLKSGSKFRTWAIRAMTSGSGHNNPSPTKKKIGRDPFEGPPPTKKKIGGREAGKRSHTTMRDASYLTDYVAFCRCSSNYFYFDFWQLTAPRDHSEREGLLRKKETTTCLGRFASLSHEWCCLFHLVASTRNLGVAPLVLWTPLILRRYLTIVCFWLWCCPARSFWLQHQLVASRCSTFTPERLIGIFWVASLCTEIVQLYPVFLIGTCRARLQSKNIAAANPETAVKLISFKQLKRREVTAFTAMNATNETVSHTKIIYIEADGAVHKRLFTCRNSKIKAREQKKEM